MLWLEIVVDSECVEHGDRDRVVPERREVQAVGRPHLGILQLPQRPHVSDDRVVLGGDEAQVLVVDRDGPTQRRLGDRPLTGRHEGSVLDAYIMCKLVVELLRACAC